MSNKEYKIFGFKKSGTKEIRYIGATTRDPKNLLSCYKCASKNGCGRPLCGWLISVDYKVDIVVLEITKDLSRKSYHIDKLGKAGKLFNVDKRNNQSYIYAGKQPKIEVSADVMIDRLCMFYRKFKRFPELKMGFNRWDGDQKVEYCKKIKLPHPNTFILKFGSYKTARNIALQKITKNSNSKYDGPKTGPKQNLYSDTELIEAMCVYKEKTGNYPIMHSSKNKFADETFRFSYPLYARRFGGVNNARALADKEFDI